MEIAFVEKVESVFKLSSQNAQLVPRNQHEKRMLAEIASVLRRVHLYQQRKFHDEVRQLVPWETLSLNASKRMLTLKAKMASGETVSGLIQAQDLFLYELLSWFKNDFFTWFQPPDCESCNRFDSSEPHKMRFSGNISPSIEEQTWLASITELYICDRCNRQFRFGRFNHPMKLLKTRTGRCGEWANCFTGICSVFNYDVRMVLETGDHVWLEVYSEGQKKWLHCDPCEQALDTPYMYENGWNKSLVYCIAIGQHGLQDVTWAYTLQPEQVLQRRIGRCREQWLWMFCHFATDMLRSFLSPDLVVKLDERTACELASYLFIPGQNQTRALRPGETDQRQSGSLMWRLSRGECSTTSQQKNFFFSPKKESLADTNNEGEASTVDRSRSNSFLIKYDVVKDIYTFGNQQQIGWASCVQSYENIYRKIEQDWKMVYLSRMESSDAKQTGKIQWEMRFDQTNRDWKSIAIRLVCAVFSGAQIKIHVQSGDVDLLLKAGEKNLILRDQLPLDCGQVRLNVELSGGEGQHSWQHAQLFRQSLNRSSQSNVLDLEIEVNF